ncbi:MAG: Thermophilic serine proteinase [Calditrichaeota bacterium]|nr:Thermophilic serine proteinase [Calditrichota bacterium]
MLLRLPVVITLSLLIISSAFSAEMPTRLILELSDQAAYTARESGVMPAVVRSYAGADAQIVPLFYEPNDPALNASWYEHGLNRWFRLEHAPDGRALIGKIPTGGDILHSELDELHHAMLMPNDFDIFNMWGLEIMECPEAWDIFQSDTEVRVTTIDTGCKITHEDLFNNMWVNPGEDLDGDGFWDESDNNGIDDDNNGFVDDLTGWDFVSIDVGDLWGDPAVGEDYGPRDNMVYPDIHGHGTHVMGTAAASTDNGIGVAAASWNAVAFPARAGFAWVDGGSLGGSGFGTDFMAAIQYVVDNGTRVISISFGGPSYQQSYQDVIDYARDNGVILFASAGNNGDDNMNYPAGYDGAIAVVASTSNDYKAGFSTYGEWVGITAPGVGIWSTMVGGYYQPQDYVAWQGTSMASPNAASVAAYILGYHPELDDDQLELVLKASADNIDSLNASYAGLLGAGRVNARRAAEYAPAGTLPVPDQLDAEVDRATGEVALAWHIDPGDHDDFLGYNIYRNGELLLAETTDETYTDQLPDAGDYTYRVRGVFGEIESLPLDESVYYSGLYGIPIVDDFEDSLDEWEVLNEANTWRFTSRQYEGEYSAGVSSPNDVYDGIQRYFAESEGASVDTWFYLSGFPVPGGQAGAVHLYSGDDRFEVFIGHSGGLWYAHPGMPNPAPFGNASLDYNRWYRLAVHYLDGMLHVILLDDEFALVTHELLEVADAPIDGVFLGSRDLDNGWSFFDVTAVKAWPAEFQQYEVVPPNDQPYPVVISEGVPGPLTDVEVAVLDDGLAVGAAAPAHDVFPVIVTAWGDPGNGEGFTSGDPITFDYRDASTGEGEELLITELFAGDGTFGSGAYTRVAVAPASGADEDAAPVGVPDEFSVGHAYPNPFNPSLAVDLALPAPGEVTVALYNVLGQRVAQSTARMSAGRHTVTLSAETSGGTLAAGVYLLRVTHAGEARTQKVVLAK